MQDKNKKIRGRSKNVYIYFHYSLRGLSRNSYLYNALMEKLLVFPKKNINKLIPNPVLVKILKCFKKNIITVY